MRKFNLLAILAPAAALLAQETREFEIAGDQTWLDTGLELNSGDSARVNAAGQLRFPGSAAAPAPCGHRNGRAERDWER